MNSDSPDDRLEVRRAAADLASDLRAWAEWAALTGAIEAPFEPPRAPSSVHPTPLSPKPHTSSAPPTPPPKPHTSSTPPTPPPQSHTPKPHTPQPRAPAPASTRAAALAAVRADLGDCTRCRLAQNRHSIVFGVGNPDATLVVVGEAPSPTEDRTGEPFVGRPGQLLTRMLAAIGLARDDVFICNIVKCHPPDSRDPLPDEIAACLPSLHGQLEAIAPRAILTVGRFAAATLTQQSQPLTELRTTRNLCWRTTPLVATYHPAFLLHSPHLKRVVWEDLLYLRELLR